jgi:hypothetical protein
MKVAAAMVCGQGLGYDGWNTHKICGAGHVVRFSMQGLAAGFLLSVKGCDGALLSFRISVMN